MKEQLQRIDDLLSKNEIKKAEIAIAKQLRAELSLSDRAQLLFRRARVRLLSARPEDALDDVLTAQSIMPTEFDSPSVLELLGDCYFARFELASLGFTDRNDTLLARQVHEAIVRDFPKYTNLGWVYYQLGRNLLTTNETESALRYFQQALLYPSSVSALTAYCYERLGFIAFYEQRDLDQSLAFLNRAIDTYPASANRNWLAQVHILRCRVLRGMHDYDGAMQAADAALSLGINGNGKKPVLSEALLTISELLSELENRDKDVIAMLQKFIQNTKRPIGIDVTWSRVNEMLGNAYFNLGQYDNALTAYQAVLQFNPDHPWVLSLYYRIARSYYQQRAYDDAIKTIYQMLEVAANEEQTINDYRVYDILGNAYFALGRYEDAVGAYQTALRMAPPNADNLSKIKSYYDLARERV